MNSREQRQRVLLSRWLRKQKGKKQKAESRRDGRRRRLREAERRNERDKLA